MTAPDVDGGAREPVRVLVQTLGLVALEGVAAVHLVVPRDHDVVEVEVDRDAGRAVFRHGVQCGPSAVRGRRTRRDGVVIRPRARADA